MKVVKVVDLLQRQVVSDLILLILFLVMFIPDSFFLARSLVCLSAYFLSLSFPHVLLSSATETTNQIEALLSAPLSSLALRVLDIPAYGKLMSYLPWNNWKEVAINLLKSVISTNSPLSELNQVEQLFKMISPLLRDRDSSSSSSGTKGDDNTSSGGADGNEASSQFKIEQNLVARIPHLMRNDDTDILLSIFHLARTQFTNGGAKRMIYTYPPLIFAVLSLARRVHEREKAASLPDSGITLPQYSTKKIFHFIIEAITALATSYPEPAMKLYLAATQLADDCNFSAIAYEFIKEALLIYECEITDSRLQVASLTSFIGTLLNCKNFPTEDYEALITKIAQYSNKLLKKTDQCRMVSLCSLLFWPPKNADGTERYSDMERVLECLQRSLKIASVSNPNLFIEILDQYVCLLFCFAFFFVFLSFSFFSHFLLPFLVIYIIMKMIVLWFRFIILML
jgi:vacuolar protein sorting-associated protein 35